jgi:serine/threonine protein kinase
MGNTGVTKKTETTTSTTSDDGLIGKQLGDYRLTSRLASGGMAQIYKGMDYKLQRQAAVKVLHQNEFENDKTLAQRFQREARAVAALEHDNIITIYQYGEKENVYFIAMKLIKGKDLAQELSKVRKAGKRLDVERALRIMEQVASALDYAHKHNVIHRDIKPSNILIDENDKAVLTDFGLVLRPSVETTMGTAFGTPRYIAPEQAISSNKAVPQSDLYSFAVILYEILVGETPFNGDSPMEIALSHISDPPPPPRSKNPQIPAAVEKELLKALEKEPEKRHKTAMDLIKAVKKGYDLTAGGAAVSSMSSLSAADSKSLIDTSSNTMPVTPDKPALTPRFGKKEFTGSTSAKAQKGGSRLMGILALLIVIGAVAAFVLSRNGSSPATTILGMNGAPVLLLYDENSFWMVNQGDYDLEMRNFKFVRSGDGGRDDYNGTRISNGILSVGGCYRISMRGQNIENPDACNSSGGDYNFELLVEPKNFFWRSETEDDTNVTSFDLMYDGRVITNCATIARGGGQRECRFNWPVAPTPQAE